MASSPPDRGVQTAPHSVPPIPVVDQEHASVFLKHHEKGAKKRSSLEDQEQEVVLIPQELLRESIEDEEGKQDGQEGRLGVLRANLKTSLILAILQKPNKGH